MIHFAEPFDEVKAYKNVFGALLEARSKCGGSFTILEDADEKTYSYNDLVKASFALGHALKSGTKIGDAVGIMLPASAGAVISFFGITAYGRVPAMLNFTSGLSNLLSACKTSGLKKIVTARKFIELGGYEKLADDLSGIVDIEYLEDVKERISKIDKLHGALGHIFPWTIRHKPHWNRSAVILFTSGTEGAPKGVVLSHRNIVSNVRQIMQHVPGVLTRNDVLFNPLPTFHCFGLTAGVLLPMLEGIRTQLHPSPLQVKEIIKRISKSGSTLLFTTDTFLSQYARASSNDELKKLRYAVCGAEGVKDETRQLVKRKFDLEILEGYGATEAAPVIAVNQPGFNKIGTVGRPLPGMELKFEPVEGIMNAGRMLVRGPNVMKGYLFEDKPTFIQSLEDQWHDTGDVVRLEEDGTLSIRGRLKRFAKIGGEMVSLAVVENCAKALWPDHDHAAAVVPDAKKGEQIILLTTNPDADRGDLQHWFQNHGVSELSLPRKLFTIEAVPLLGSGKMDIGGVQELANRLTQDTSLLSV